MHLNAMRAALCAGVVLGSTAAWATEISLVMPATGNDVAYLQELSKKYEKLTGDTVKIVPMPSSTTDQFGQYRLWLAAGTKDIDIYQTDVIWARQLADQFIDLSAAAKDVVKDHFPSIIESQTVDGKLVAIPSFTDAPALFYRKDLLDKYGKPVPKTWDELTATAKEIQDKERAAGNKDMWGFVFQGNAYEGLTCDALEMGEVVGGGQIVEANGDISINNDKAAKALETAKSWVGVISPPGVLAYQEEEARGVWQTGNAVFMRNWPYAFSLGNGADSAIKGKFDVATLPTGAAADKPAATLGGWNWPCPSTRSTRTPPSVSPSTSVEGSAEGSRDRPTHLPTIISLYDDPDVAKAQPTIPRWKAIFMNAVPRPSAPTKVKYNEVSSLFWSAVHDTLSGKGSAADNLEVLEAKLTELKGSGW